MFKSIKQLVKEAESKAVGQACESISFPLYSKGHPTECSFLVLPFVQQPTREQMLSRGTKAVTFPGPSTQINSRVWSRSPDRIPTATKISPTRLRDFPLEPISQESAIPWIIHLISPRKVGRPIFISATWHFFFDPLSFSRRAHDVPVLPLFGAHNLPGCQRKCHFNQSVRCHWTQERNQSRCWQPRSSRDPLPLWNRANHCEDQRISAAIPSHPDSLVWFDWGHVCDRRFDFYASFFSHSVYSPLMPSNHSPHCPLRIRPCPKDHEQSSWSRPSKEDPLEPFPLFPYFPPLWY